MFVALGVLCADPPSSTACWAAHTLRAPRPASVQWLQGAGGTRGLAMGFFVLSWSRAPSWAFVMTCSSLYSGLLAKQPGKPGLQGGVWADLKTNKKKRCWKLGSDSKYSDLFQYQTVLDLFSFSAVITEMLSCASCVDEFPTAGRAGMLLAVQKVHCCPSLLRDFRLSSSCPSLQSWVIRFINLQIPSYRCKPDWLSSVLIFRFLRITSS